MKYAKLLFTFLLTIGCFFILNTKLGDVPPLGKFLNPYDGIWQNEIDETVTGEISIPGLEDKVTVHYDAQMIPHIFAQNERDLYRAQGYITAKHRLWQLEFQTLAAAGRLSEIIGESALNYDRSERRRGMGFGADEAMSYMEKNDPETLGFIQDYADGVNAYIDQLAPEDYPVEYKLLDYAPEKWTPKKTALLLMYMTKMLAGGDRDLDYTNALRLFGKENFDLLYPDFFNINDPIIPKDTDWSFIDIPRTSSPNIDFVTDSIAVTIEKPDPDNGSNNWAVSGRKSVSGYPILANDPHLGLKLPAIWFVMQLSTPTHNAMGATIPGALGVISGFNEHIAWAETNAKRDLIDWYKIELNQDRTQYYYDGQWKDLTLRVEEISIKGDERFKDTVLYTHHGPIVFDKNFKYDSRKVLTGYAMKWIGHVGGNNQRTFIELLKAKNYDDFVEAISYWNAPAQNFVFASTQGDIAMWIQGKFPNKWQDQGKFLMDGSRPENDWQSYIPQQFNAKVKNPEQGFVSSANQHPTDENYPYYVYNDRYQLYRNRVINDFFRSKEKFSVQDFIALQNNNYNLFAAELIPYMVQHMNASGLSKEEEALYEEIKDWKFNNDVEEAGPSIWRLWFDTLYDMVWDEFDIENTVLEPPFDYQTIYLLKNYGSHEFMDKLDTDEKETAADLFLLAFKHTAARILEIKNEKGDYSWATSKSTYAGHLLQSLPAFSSLNISTGGGRNVVNATSENKGPSLRMIVEMSTPPKALGIYPGGQSGNPGSKYYDDFINDWAEGKYHTLHFLTSNQATDAMIGTQTLVPKR